MNSYFVDYKEQNERPNIVGSERIPSTCVTIPDWFQRRVYGIDLRCGSGIDLKRRSCFDLMVMNPVLIQRDSFPILYPHAFYFTSIEEVPRVLEDLSTDGFYVWDSQNMRAIGHERKEYS